MGGDIHLVELESSKTVLMGIRIDIRDKGGFKNFSSFTEANSLR